MKTRTAGFPGDIRGFLSHLFLRFRTPYGLPKRPDDQPAGCAAAGTTLWNGQMLLPGIAEPYQWDFGEEA